MVAVLFISLLVFMVIGIPIAVSIGLSSLIYILAKGIPLVVVGQRMYTGIDSIVLVAIPCFIIAGAVMEFGGLASRLVRFAEVFVAKLTGGLSMVTILASMFFSAISGSNVATTAAVGGIMIPEMYKRGYNKSYAAAVAAAGGIMGVIIPPSLSMVIYGAISDTSVAALFLGGIPIGILMGLSLMIVCYIMAREYGYGGVEEDANRPGFFKVFIDAFWALGTPVIMIGGILGGIFTPTEAAIVAVVYGSIVSIFIYKEIKFKDLYKIFLNATVTSAKIMFIIANAAVFGWVLAAEQIPQKIFVALTSFSTEPIILLLIINIVLLIAGCFMETSSLLIILTPVLMPVANAIGLSPVHFGLIMVLNLAIGNLTPPLGVCLFTGAMVSGAKVEQVSKYAVPFLIALLIVLFMVTYIPQLSLFLPKIFMPKTI